MQADAAPDTGPAPPTTSWARVALLVLAGIVVALPVGKVPAALPALRDELGLSLVAAGWVVSVFSVIAACAGVVVGGIADRIGHLRIVLAGLAFAALANAAGAFATDAASLLAGRVGEGLGFILAVVALPPLIVANASPADRGKALGIWGAFLPAGMGLMLLASPPILDIAGWRGLWLVNGAAAGLCACCLALALRGSAAARAGPPAPLRAVLSVLACPAPLLLAFCFAVYSAQFVAVTSFLPTLLIDQGGLGLGLAASLGAVVVLANIVGNTATGWLLAAGLSRPALIACGFAAMGEGAVLVFSSALPLGPRIAAAIAFSACGGLIPGTLMSSAPVYAPAPALVATVIGLMLQGAGFGQVFGVPALARTVTGFGSWDYAAAFTVAAALTGLAACVALTRVPPTHDPSRHGA